MNTRHLLLALHLFTGHALFAHLTESTLVSVKQTPRCCHNWKDLLLHSRCQTPTSFHFKKSSGCLERGVFNRYFNFANRELHLMRTTKMSLISVKLILSGSSYERIWAWIKWLSNITAITNVAWHVIYASENGTYRSKHLSRIHPSLPVIWHTSQNCVDHNSHKLQCLK